jgi:hypothetical protein
MKLRKVWQKEEHHTTQQKIEINGSNGSKDPEVWIVELKRMQTKLNAMGATVSDNMVIGHILSRLPAQSTNPVPLTVFLKLLLLKL